MPIPLVIAEQGILYAIPPDQVDLPLSRALVLAEDAAITRTAKPVRPVIEASAKHLSKSLLQTMAGV